MYTTTQSFFVHIRNARGPDLRDRTSRTPAALQAHARIPEGPGVQDSRGWQVALGIPQETLHATLQGLRYLPRLLQRVYGIL